MRRVIIESPWAADTPEQQKLHIDYLRAAIRDCLDRGESPYASHGLLTAVLNDDEPADRAMGIDAGLAWGEVADATVVYGDLGSTTGMMAGINHAHRHGRPVELRRILEDEEGAAMTDDSQQKNGSQDTLDLDDVAAGHPAAERQLKDMRTMLDRAANAFFHYEATYSASGQREQAKRNRAMAQRCSEAAHG